MRSGLLGGMICLSLAGGVFVTLASQSMRQTTKIVCQSELETPPVAQCPEGLNPPAETIQEPQRLTLIRFDEPRLAAPNQPQIIPAGFVSKGVDGVERAPSPRKCRQDGGIPLLEGDDLY